MSDPKYAVALAPVHSLAIAGSGERFPVNRIFCVGRNYAAHAREMGQDEREPPFFFMKPANAAVDASAAVTIPYPSMTSNFHHEVELVVAIGTGGANVSMEHAESLVFGYAVGLDMTRRDLQFAARDKGRPWEFGKSFDASAPIGAITPIAKSGALKGGAISLAVNQVSKQSSDLSLMIWSVAESIAYLSKYEALQPGDVIMTGTPEGVGAVKAGDVMHARIAGLEEITVRVAGG
ncbi:fumarylpyruvate hydrolase [Panacagrimonas perspica]|uniref:Fumarylpyruvate hydrolase n=1 Tax=Panacagrimonas perspica TaxID=381431 RepID=A0A4S3K794_9GAMM|nr:fumarylacetoacetate hydrolase family protein [Panacagrimonas perspica]TDU26689.1 fumarylpyruvate hydrolase [Panacagrimonas perspica]THD04036.1 fumarylacetoacetate hydrolase [Panacagrimonas perspica]